MEKNLKIVVTGPESSGKTLLTELLARALDLPWSPEFARYYVGALGRPYRRADLVAIGRGQRLWEDWYGRGPGPVLCDTDWTVLHVWESYGYGAAGEFEWQKGYGPARPADLYLLCRPNFPWQPDPLREHPREREILFGLYETLLRDRQLPFVTLSGDRDERVREASRHILQLRNRV